MTIKEERYHDALIDIVDLINTSPFMLYVGALVSDLEGVLEKIEDIAVTAYSKED